MQATPGRTKHFQTINLSDSLMLCDCPGLVFPQFSSSKAEMALAGVLPLDRLTDVRMPIGLIARRFPRAYLEALYHIIVTAPMEHEDPDRPPTASEVTTPSHHPHTRAGKHETSESHQRVVVGELPRFHTVHSFSLPDHGVVPKRYQPALKPHSSVMPCELRARDGGGAFHAAAARVRGEPWADGANGAAGRAPRGARDAQGLP